MTDLPEHVPLSLSDDLVAPLYARDPETGARLADDDLDALAGALRHAHGQAEQVLSLSKALRADPTKSPSAVALTLREKGLKAGEQAAQSLDRARNSLAVTVARLSEQTAAPLLARDAGTMVLEGEIRAALARLSPKDRTAAIGRAFEDGEDSVIGAVLRGPALLSGLGPDQRQMLQDRYRRERHPQEADRIMRLTKALDGLERGAVALLGFTEAIVTAPRALAAERAAERTEQALAGFN
jgi:hypothetical protein